MYTNKPCNLANIFENSQISKPDVFSVDGYEHYNMDDETPFRLLKMTNSTKWLGCKFEVKKTAKLEFVLDKY